MFNFSLRTTACFTIVAFASLAVHFLTQHCGSPQAFRSVAASATQGLPANKSQARSKGRGPTISPPVDEAGRRVEGSEEPISRICTLIEKCAAEKPRDKSEFCPETNDGRWRVIISPDLVHTNLHFVLIDLSTTLGRHSKIGYSGRLG
jgi:hypothetical protein